MKHTYTRQYRIMEIEAICLEERQLTELLEIVHRYGSAELSGAIRPELLRAVVLQEFDEEVLEERCASVEQWKGDT